MACSIATLLASAGANGFTNLQDRELRICILQLLCDISNFLVPPQTCLVCDTVDPTAVPTCSCALAMNLTDSTLWYWDKNAAAWYKFG